MCPTTRAGTKGETAWWTGPREAFQSPPFPESRLLGPIAGPTRGDRFRDRPRLVPGNGSVGSMVTPIRIHGWCSSSRPLGRWDPLRPQFMPALGVWRGIAGARCVGSTWWWAAPIAAAPSSQACHHLANAGWGRLASLQGGMGPPSLLTWNSSISRLSTGATKQPSTGGSGRFWIMVPM